MSYGTFSRTARLAWPRFVLAIWRDETMRLDLLLRDQLQMQRLLAYSHVSAGVGGGLRRRPVVRYRQLLRGCSMFFAILVVELVV